MEDKEYRTVVPRDVLVKEGIAAVAHLAGGVFLLIMTIGARSRLLGLALPAAALILGIITLLSKDREDKKPGLILSAAGVLGMLSRFGPGPLKPFTAFLLGLGAVGLFAAGIWKGVKFLIDLKTRS